MQGVIQEVFAPDLSGQRWAQLLGAQLSRVRGHASKMPAPVCEKRRAETSTGAGSKPSRLLAKPV
eukprot:1161167-Pelagomonas_calceolata.AAC.7